MSSLGSGHVSRWPRYTTTGRSRILSYLEMEDDGTAKVVTEQGEITRVGDWDAFKGLLHGIGADCYVDGSLCSARAFPWLGAALCDPDTHAPVGATGGLLGLWVKKGRRVASVVPAGLWGEARGHSLLQILRQLYDHLQVGDYPTPGALGEATLRSMWARLGLERVSRPNQGLRAQLMSNALGGRCDTPGLGGLFGKLYEYDLRSAYAAMARTVPGGECWSFTYEPKECGTWYGQCTVDIGHRLELGPFGVRLPSGLLDYPTAPGTYRTWLWREEAQASRAAGAAVTVHRGTAWGERDTILTPWATFMDLKRTTAPSRHVEALVKVAIVAGIGRHGMAPQRRFVVAEPADRDEPLVDAAGAWPWVDGRGVRTEPEPDAPWLTHWASYIVMRCRVALYRRMLAELRDGNRVVLSNFDAVYTSDRTRLPLGVDLGEWRENVLTNVRVVAPRSFVSDQKTRLPGQPHAERYYQLAGS